MISYVLDTSVAGAWYLPEAFAPEARTFRDRLVRGEIRLLVPSLHYWELGNVLRTYARRGVFDTETAREIFAVHLDAPLEVQEPDRDHVLAVALEYESTVYDAVFIALALENEISLLTAERTTTPWVVRLGDRIVGVGRSA
jgi:predicted nucleic acid-binding protein